MRLTPLLLKNVAMKYVFYRVGDRKSTTTISNLGAGTCGRDGQFVLRLDFILGPLSATRSFAEHIS
jgi:hypothetical protein